MEWIVKKEKSESGYNLVFRGGGSGGGVRVDGEYRGLTSLLLKSTYKRTIIVISLDTI